MSETDRNQGVALSLRTARPYLWERKPTVGPDYLEGIQRAELANAHLTSKRVSRAQKPNTNRSS